jgi:uncharacterized membrane protein (DUF106 family)
MGWFDPIAAWLKQYVPTSPPGATVFILILSLGLSLMALIIQRLMIDVKGLRARQLEISKYDREKLKATRAGDKRTLAKLKREELRINQMRMQNTKEQFKTMPVLFVPFILIFWIFSALYGNEVVAVLPLSLPLMGNKLSFFWWYFIAYSAVNLPLSRVFGVLPAGPEG